MGFHARDRQTKSGIALESGSGVHFTTVRATTLLLLAASAAIGQTPRRATDIPSMGQPPLWQPYAVPGGMRAPDKQWRGAFTAGIHHPITHPVAGLLGIAGEVYGTANPGVQPGATTRQRKAQLTQERIL